MNHHDQEKFLKELLADDALQGVRQDSLAQGLAAMRRRRRGRALAPVAALAGVALLVGANWWMRQAAVAPESTRVASLSKPAAVAPAPAIATISDAELLALFPDQTAALIGPPGQQEFVLFDRAGEGWQL